MYSISFLATALILAKSMVEAQKISGNLGLCLPGSGSTGGENCLGWTSPAESLHGVFRPVEAPTMNWNYDHGLLRAVVEDPGAVDVGANGLCLGPVVSRLSTEACKPYELELQECPETNAGDDMSMAMARTRRMRFLITSEGTVQSMASVVDPVTGRDTISTKPFCLAMMKLDEDPHEKAYLVPCSETDHPLSEEDHESPKHHKFFDVYGSYSGSFLVPLRQLFAYDETVELAYQVGLPQNRWGTNPVATGASVVEISMPWPIDGINQIHQPLEKFVVEVIPLDASSTGGILSFAPSAFQVEGHMTATLKDPSLPDDVPEHHSLPTETCFVVAKASSSLSIGKGPHSSYKIFALVLGCFVACFLLATVADKLCQKKTRPSGDPNHDGKTVCLTKEEEDFPIEDPPEEGIEKEDNNNETDGTSDTDLDESRHSEIPLEICERPSEEEGENATSTIDGIEANQEDSNV